MIPIKVFIPTLNRPMAIKTHQYFKHFPLFDVKIVVHDDEQAAAYTMNATIDPAQIVVSGEPHNISAQRNWIKNNLVKAEDKWFLMMDDNIEGFNIFPFVGDEFDRGDKSLRVPYEAAYPDIGIFYATVLATILHAEAIGAGFCGFATIENYFFRNRHWKTISMVCSKACIVKNDELRWDENIKTMDDYGYSCEALLKYGKVLVNAFVWPNAKHNQVGGLGTLSERGEKKKLDCQYLMHKYSGLFRYKDRKNSLPGAEIVLRGYSEKFFDNWREKYESVKEAL